MLEYILIILLCLIISLVFILFYNYNSKKIKNLQNENDTLLQQTRLYENLKKDDLRQYFTEEWNKEEGELKQKFQNEENKLKQALQLEIQKHEFRLSTLNKKIESTEAILKEKEKRYDEVNQDLNTYKKGKIEEINEAAAEYEQRKFSESIKAVEERNTSMKKGSAELQEQLRRAEEVLKQKIEETKKELEEERRKRAAINEEILKQREVEEQQDFYKIQLDPGDKDDVEILRSIAPRLRHSEAINKIIWSGYYQKPLAELRKRLLPNGDVSCVYKATRLKTGEIYIGQTVSFDKRLQEHTRSALGIGSLASSQLHRKMLEDGPEQFTWQILEIVPKDKLRERESYYIDFYDSKTYGLNSVSGDKK